MASVMVVDDSKVMRHNLRLMIEKGGHEVVAEAADGATAIQLYAEHKPDVVTMDITMPLMDGLGATREILTRYPEAKIIIVSALGQKIMILEAIEYGVKSYILKPFEDQKVLDTIEKVINPGHL